MQEKLWLGHEGAEGTLSLEKILRPGAQSLPTRHSVETQEAPKRVPTSAHALCQPDSMGRRPLGSATEQCGLRMRTNPAPLRAWLPARETQLALWLVPVAHGPSDCTVGGDPPPRHTHLMKTYLSEGSLA